MATNAYFPAAGEILRPRLRKSPNNGRVRRVITRTGTSFRVNFPSVKLGGRGVHCESILEWLAAMHLEYHPAVASYQEQPEEIGYTDEWGVTRTYTPDFRVDFLGGRSLLVEVKPAARLADPRSHRLLGHVANMLARRGQPFRVWTDMCLRRNPLLRNLEALHGANKPAPADEALELVLAGLEARCDATTLADLIHRVASRRTVLRQLARGRWTTDLERPLAPDQIVHLHPTLEHRHGSFSY